MTVRQQVPVTRKDLLLSKLAPMGLPPRAEASHMIPSIVRLSNLRLVCVTEGGCLRRADSVASCAQRSSTTTNGIGNMSTCRQFCADTLVLVSEQMRRNSKSRATIRFVVITCWLSVLESLATSTGLFQEFGWLLLLQFVSQLYRKGGQANRAEVNIALKLSIILRSPAKPGWYLGFALMHVQYFGLMVLCLVGFAK